MNQLITGGHHSVWAANGYSTNLGIIFHFREDFFLIPVAFEPLRTVTTKHPLATGPCIYVRWIIYDPKSGFKMCQPSLLDSFPLTIILADEHIGMITHQPKLMYANIILRYFPLRTIIYDGHGRVIVIHPNGSV